MYKVSKIIFCIIFLNVLFSCKKRVTKTRTKLNTEIFFGYKRYIPNDSLINQVSADYNVAFGLKPIEHSKNINEIRLFFLGPFVERFFIEKKSNDSINANIYNCKTIQKGDSLLMKIGDIITVNYKFKFDQMPNSDSIPFLVSYSKDTSETILDGGVTYYYEIKKGSAIKKGIIDAESKPGKQNKEDEYVLNFIKNISDKYSFDFKNSWEDIDSSFLPK
jgi:hypothetical protein